MKKMKIMPKFLSIGSVAVLCVFGAGNVQAQSASLSIQQNGEKVIAVGTAIHSLSGKSLTIKAKNGKVSVSNGNNIVASVPYTNGGELVVECSDFSESPNTLAATVDSLGYSTLYSPFQLTVPSDSEVEVYAPTLVDGKLMLTEETRLSAGTVINPETGLVLKNPGGISFSLTGDASSSVESALSGSSLTVNIPVIDGYTLCTLGRAQSDTSLVGFFKNTDSPLVAGKAYLLVSDAQATAECIPFGNITGIVNTTSVPSAINGKRLENGHIIIIKNSRRYTTYGIRVY